MRLSTAAVAFMVGLVGVVLLGSTPDVSAEPAVTPDPEPLVEPIADDVIDALLAEAWERPWQGRGRGVGPWRGMRQQAGPPERRGRGVGPWQGMRQQAGPPEQRERMEQLRHLAEKLRDMVREFGPDHPKVQRLREMLSGLRSRMSQRPGRLGPGPPGLRESRRDRPDEQMRRMAGHLEMIERLQRTVGEPLQSIIIAAHGIVELSGDDPEMAVDVLQDLLEKVEATPARTAIHFVLKDACMRAGERERAVEHLRAVIEENSRMLKRLGARPRRVPTERRPDRPRRGAEPRTDRPREAPEKD